MLAPLLLAPAPAVKVGVPAPSLGAVRWVRGGAPLAGHVRVVEFWATWCAPCRENIPRLTRVAKRHAGRVDVVGIDVWEDRHSERKGTDALAVARDFVARQGGRMSYAVGVDRPDGRVARAWLDAAGWRAIPAAFVVDARGRLAWLGNAYDLDAALDAVLAGAKDPARAVAQTKARRGAIEARLKAAAERGDLTGVLTLRRRLPDSVSMDAAFAALYRRDPAKARGLADAIARDPNAGMWQFLDLASWALSGRGEPSPDDCRFAARMAEEAERRADPSDDSRLACLSYQVEALAKAGDLADAARAQERAIGIMEASAKDYARDLAEARRRRADLLAGRGGAEPARNGSASPATTAP